MRAFVLTDSPNQHVFERFQTKFSLGNNGCWVWHKPNPTGYAHMKVDGKTLLGHRMSYEYFIGSIPIELTLDHLCRNPSCVNPWHLEAVTQRINTLRGTSPIAKNAIKTHCGRDHEYNEENTYLYRGRRGCRKCRLIAVNQHAERKRS